MTSDSKQEKAPKDVKFPKEPGGKISDEKARPSVTKFKSKFWRYGLLTFIIVLGLIYVIVYPSFDTNSILNKFEKSLEYWRELTSHNRRKARRYFNIKKY
jgi:hypothetical protein